MRMYVPPQHLFNGSVMVVYTFNAPTGGAKAGGSLDLMASPNSQISEALVLVRGSVSI